MRSRVSRALAWRFVSALAVLWSIAGFSGSVPAQDRPPTAMKPVVAELSADLNSVLVKGADFERQHKWDEALTFYEDARKHFPGDARVEQLFARARKHYDVSRRYNEASFRHLAGDLSLQQALTIYDEVMTKIETHYVEQPKWKQLADRGTDQFEIALGEEVFTKRNLQGVAPDRIEAVRAEVRKAMDPARIESRRDAFNAVHWVAHYSNKELGLPAAAVVMEYVCGAANSLDDYSSFLSGGELKDVYAQIQGNFVGLGIELKGTKQGLLVIRVISGSPAQEAGLKPRDVILAVDGKSTLDTSADKAADMLQGPENSTVRVTIETAGQSPREVSVTRRKVEVPSVEEIKILDSTLGIGYFRMTSFQESTDQEVNQALWKLHKQGMKSLIVDVRGNPGGLLRSAVDVVGRFVSHGPASQARTIVSTKGRNELENQTYKAQNGEDQTWHVPLVVLIDGDSASASEIFAGAIRDHQRGTLVGRKSYGKGSVQGIFSLKSEGTGIRLTTAKFYSPLGKPFVKVGVSPDVEVRQAAKPTDEGRFVSTEGDRDVAEALNVARENMARRAQRAR